MTTPSEAAQNAWNEFEKTIRSMSREDYADACDELEMICQSSSQCVRDEIEADE